MMNLTISNNVSRKTDVFDDNISLAKAIEQVGLDFSAGSTTMWNGRIVDAMETLEKLNRENPTTGDGPASVCIFVALKNA